MSHIFLGIVACTSAVFGLVFNAYIILALVYNNRQKTRAAAGSSGLLLLHLALVDILWCLETLSMTTPAAVDEQWAGGAAATCEAHGFAWTALLPVAAWTLCGLNCDRYAAIAAPLHYSRLVRGRRVAVFLAAAWLLGVALAVPPLFGGIGHGGYVYRPERATCAADFTDPASGPWYPLAYTGLSLLLPAAVILLCNLRVLAIARHHRHRIVAAIYEVTLRAQATIVHQRCKPFYLQRKYKGRCAVSTVAQLMGSAALLYGPQCVLMVWEASTGHTGPPVLAGVAAGLVACSPLVNGFVYGVKSRALREAFKSFLRRQLYASEVRNEIQRRGSVMGSSNGHAWSYVLLRMHKNGFGSSSVLTATPKRKRQEDVPEVAATTPPDPAVSCLGLAGLELTLGIGLSTSGDSIMATDAQLPVTQPVDDGGNGNGGGHNSLKSRFLSSEEVSALPNGGCSKDGGCGCRRRSSLEIRLLQPEADDVSTGRSGCRSLDGSAGSRRPSEDDGTLERVALLSASSGSGCNGAARSEGETEVLHLCKDNGGLGLRRSPCLELLLPTLDGRRSCSHKALSSQFVESGIV